MQTVDPGDIGAAACSQRGYVLLRSLPCSICHRQKETSFARGFGGICGTEAGTTYLRVYEENRDC